MVFSPSCLSFDFQNTRSCPTSFPREIFAHQHVRDRDDVLSLAEAFAPRLDDFFRRSDVFYVDYLLRRREVEFFQNLQRHVVRGRYDHDRTGSDGTEICDDLRGGGRRTRRARGVSRLSGCARISRSCRRRCSPCVSQGRRPIMKSALTSEATSCARWLLPVPAGPTNADVFTPGMKAPPAIYSTTGSSISISAPSERNFPTSPS